jgi:hypothetical protein
LLIGCDAGKHGSAMPAHPRSPDQLLGRAVTWVTVYERGLMISSVSSFIAQHERRLHIRARKEDQAQFVSGSPDIIFCHRI